MSIQDIEITTWLLWVAIGIVTALLAAALFGGRRLLGFDLFVGLVGAVAGGFGSVLIIGDNTPGLMIISSMTAFFCCLLTVYVYNRLVFRSESKNNNRYENNRD